MNRIACRADSPSAANQSPHPRERGGANRRRLDRHIVVDAIPERLDDVIHDFSRYIGICRTGYVPASARASVNMSSTMRESPSPAARDGEGFAILDLLSMPCATRRSLQCAWVKACEMCEASAMNGRCVDISWRCVVMDDSRRPRRSGTFRPAGRVVARIGDRQASTDVFGAHLSDGRPSRRMRQALTRQKHRDAASISASARRTQVVRRFQLFVGRSSELPATTMYLHCARVRLCSGQAGAVSSSFLDDRRGARRRSDRVQRGQGDVQVVTRPPSASSLPESS